jgi:hypothetical protein
MAPRDNTLTGKILSMFKNSSLGLTDAEIAQHLDVECKTITTLRCRFATSGEIVWDGSMRQGANGRSNKVYKHKKYIGNAPVVRSRRKQPQESGISRSDKIREAIAGLLSIIQLIETNLPKASGRKARKPRTY